MKYIDHIKKSIAQVLKYKKTLGGAVATLVSTTIFSLSLDLYHEVKYNTEEVLAIHLKQTALKASFTHRTDHVDTVFISYANRIDKIEAELVNFSYKLGALNPMQNEIDVLLQKIL